MFIPNAFHQHELLLNYNNDITTCMLGLLALDLTSLKMKAAVFLHPSELEYFKTLHYEKRQLSFLLGRYCAKQLIANYTNKALTEFSITSGIFRQPIIKDVPNLEISVSHCETLSAAIIFPREVIMGIDVEIPQSRYASLLQQELIESEINLLARTFLHQPIIVGLTAIWTIKEALAKALKTGLTIPANLLEVENFESLPNCWISSFKNFPQYEGMTLINEFVLSIVYPRPCKSNIDVQAIHHSLLRLQENQKSFISVD